MRRQLTRNWSKITAHPLYPRVEEAFKRMELMRLGGYSSGSEINYPEFISTVAHFSVSFPMRQPRILAMRDVTPQQDVGLLTALDILQHHGLEAVVFRHDGWKIPHVVIILDYTL